MKHLTLLLVLIASFSYGQELKDKQYLFQATHTATTNWDSNLEDWEEWSEWEENKILISIKAPVKGFMTMKIFSATEQHYTAYSMDNVDDEYTDGTKATIWDVVAEDGEEMWIKIINYIDSQDQIIVTHLNYRVSYSIKALN